MNLLVKRFRFWLGQAKRRRDLQEEMELHIAEKTAELLEQGVSESEARAEARRRFGSTTRVADQARDVWEIRWLEDFWRDVRHGSRTLSRNLGFTAVAVLTLALGVGGTAAVYTIVDAVLLQALPYKDPDRLVAIWGSSIRDANVSKIYLPFADFEEFRLKSLTLESVAAGTWAGRAKNHVLSGLGPPQILAIPVSASFFQMLGVSPLAGRTFAAEDEASGLCCRVGALPLDKHLCRGCQADRSIDRAQSRILRSARRDARRLWLLSRAYTSVGITRT